MGRVLFAVLEQNMVVILQIKKWKTSQWWSWAF